MRNNMQTELAQISSLLSLNPYKAPILELAAAVRKLPEDERRHLLLVCEKVLKSRKIGFAQQEPVRVSTVKVIVALVPDSIQFIKRLLINKGGKKSYELHFTLFCWLDQLRVIPGAAALSKRIPSLIKEYLMHIGTDASHAAWMAGDLMGNHWPLREAIPVLLHVAKEAKYAAGRQAAVDGLAKALKRTKLGSIYYKRVNTAVESISRSDRSQKVKLAAECALANRIPYQQRRDSRVN